VYGETAARTAWKSAAFMTLAFMADIPFNIGARALMFVRL
jgi:hypothetical protein